MGGSGWQRSVGRRIKWGEDTAGAAVLRAMDPSCKRLVRRVRTSVNSPSIVKIGTRTAPPPMPAADAITVAKNMPIAHAMSALESGKTLSFSSVRGAWKRVKHFCWQYL